MAIHSFNTEVAKRVGVIAAVIYDHFAFWCEQNRQNGLNEKDGEFWTYHSVKELQEAFDYLTIWQIRNAINRLIDEGLIKVGCYNRLGIDRTRWFSVIDTDLRKTTNDLMNTTNGLRNTTNGLMKTTNAFAENHKAIPDTTTDTTLQILHTDKNSSKTFRPPTVDEVRAYCQERGNSVDPEQFIDFYTSKGWIVGKNKMKDWKASVRTWEKRDDKKSTPQKDSNPYRALLKQKGLFDDTAGDNLSFK